MPIPLPSPSGASLSDLIHRVREMADKYTPGPGTATSLMGGPLGWLMLAADKGGMPTAQILNNHTVAGSAAPPAAPAAQPSAPSVNVPALGGLGLFPGAPSQPNTAMNTAQSYMAHPQATAPVTAPAPAPQAAPPQQIASPPMPQARPAGAPQAQPDTGFFMRNALMMQDPNGGGYIDPQGAASVRGPDLIKKMTAYLHNKDMG